MNADLIVWCDTETTGLDRERCSIVELGFIITDRHLVEVARASWVVSADMATWEDGALAMHLESGLLAEVLGADALATRDAEYLARLFLADHGVTPGEHPLAGAGIAFDRAFLAREMPYMHGRFHYRSLDVTTFRLLAEYRGVEVPAKREVHRVLPDIEDAIALARVAWGWIGGAA